MTCDRRGTETPLEAGCRCSVCRSWLLEHRAELARRDHDQLELGEADPDQQTLERWSHG